MHLKLLKVLVLEDNIDDVVMVERVLKKENLLFETKNVDSRRDFLKSLKEFRPDIILSDHSLPQFNSMEALKICRENGLDIPFILVTGTVSEEFAVECLRKGADDYILKSNLARLPSAIENAIQKREHEIFRKAIEGTLQRKNQELTKINKELDSFVYSISHNLRSPLMSVLGLLHITMLDYKGKDPALEIYLKKMEDSINKLDDTLKEIIDYSKNAHVDPKAGEVNLQHLIDKSLEKFQYINGFDVVTKEITIHQKVPFYSDNFRISIVINNLVSNAIKYRDSRKKTSFLHISSHVDAEYLTMTIEDNGIGIQPECLPKIYNMFFRATEISEGSGLGLYIVKESIERLKGEISVSSQHNIGTCFKITVPNHYRALKRTIDIQKIKVAKS